MIDFQFLLLDLLSLLWISLVFIILFIGLPSKIVFTKLRQNWDSKIVSYLARSSLAIIVGVAILSALRLFSWLTLVLWYVGFLFLGWRYSYKRQDKEHFPERIWERLILTSIDLLDSFACAERNREFSFTKLKIIFLKTWQRSQQKIHKIIIAWQLNRSDGMLGAIATATILCLAILLRYEYPLQELRFSHPDSYHDLLVTRQILSRDLLPISNFSVFSAIVAVISLLGSIDPMQIIRFLPPFLGFLLVLSVGYCVRNLGRDRASSLAAMFGLGAYLFTWNEKISDRLPQWWQEFLLIIKDNLNASLVKQWTGGDFEVGAIFLLLALGIAAEKKFRSEAIVTSSCCLIIVAIASPPLLILALIGGVGLMVGNRLALTLVSIVWLSLALISAIPNHPLQLDRVFLVTLPVALSLLLGLLFLIISHLLKIIFGKWTEVTCLILLFAISINFLLPIAPKINYLEYESAARQSLQIRSLFPRKGWIIVAPIEQLAQNYGFGWYEDLAEFTKKYASEVSKSNFKFPYSVPDLFVFVEKRPFVSFPDIKSLPYSLLVDPTFNNYRSSYGRASLQFEALKLCEDYLRLRSTTALSNRRKPPIPHLPDGRSRDLKNNSIYYEDNNLRIYHFKINT